MVVQEHSKLQLEVWALQDFLQNWTWLLEKPRKEEQLE